MYLYLYIYIYINLNIYLYLSIYFKKRQNSYQQKPFNKTSSQKEESLTCSSNCSIESSCSASTSSSTTNDKDKIKDQNNCNNSNNSNDINDSSSSFMENIRQIKNNARNQCLRVSNKDWNKKFSYFDADFTMRAMVIKINIHI